jgi:ferrous iron transport protein A
MTLKSRFIMSTIPLYALKQGLRGKIHAVTALHPSQSVDPIAIRLAELGFCTGEIIQIVALTPFKYGPLIIKLGNTRFALRHHEAARILVNEVA